MKKSDRNDAAVDELEVLKQTVESWQRAKQTPAWAFAAAAAHARWPIGLLVDEATYDGAVEAAKHVELSSPSIRVRSKRSR
jgi:hypothetical protein